MPRRTPRSGEQGAVEVNSAISSIDAKMKLLAQRLKIIEMNEQVIGRTLVSHNKKLKELEHFGSAMPDLSQTKLEVLASIRPELDQIKADSRKAALRVPTSLMVEEAGSFKTADAENDVRSLRKAMSNLKQEVDELKYILASVNPMEYVTITELSDIIEKKVEKELGKRKKVQ
ncbi:hypothetical protein K8R43_04130 [archaeon]|nr:hypothetical protein [archaeon]